MTDVMQLLREANPVKATPLDVPATMRERALGRTGVRPTGLRRGRWLASTLAAAAAVATAAVVGLPGHSDSLGLAGRAYAASTATGIAHWRTTISAYTDGRLVTKQLEEGWSGDGVVHRLNTTVNGGNTVVTERREEGGREVHRVDGGPEQDGPAPRTDLDVLLPGSDPLEAFREAYRAGKLERVSATRFRVLVPAGLGGGKLSLVYDIDSETALPRSLTETATTSDGGAGNLVTRQVVMRFDVYEHLPPGPAATSKLRLLP